MNQKNSQALFKRALKSLVGGVNSPVRAFKSVGMTPRFIDRAKGPWLWDAEGRKYTDYVGSWGAMILGHGRAEALSAIRRDLSKGLSYGACHEREIEMAELLRGAFPKTIEKVRLAGSGTEAVMTALRIARSATGRDITVKFAGGYHGHHDSLLTDAGSGLTTLGIPASKGVPRAWARTTLTLPYNDLEAVERVFAAHRKKIAAVIVEPVACNMGVVPPAPGFLNGLRRMTKAHGAVLIFDEVITGFRVRWGGALGGIPPGPGDAGKNHRRRAPRRGGGRARLFDGRARPARRRLPRGNAFRKSGGLVLRHRHAQGTQKTQPVPEASDSNSRSGGLS
jgi:glutamate-1-semialdehyde 2,1-aminomutase